MRLTYEGMKFSGTITDMKKYLEEKVRKQEEKLKEIEELMYSKCEQDALEDKI